jgi:hypothetical protein
LWGIALFIGIVGTSPAMTFSDGSMSSKHALAPPARMPEQVTSLDRYHHPGLTRRMGLQASGQQRTSARRRQLHRLINKNNGVYQ